MVSDERRITWAKKLSAARAILTAGRVSDEIRIEREEICSTCSQRRVDNKRIAYCGMCGCSVSSEKTKLFNLCRYEENLPHWGCKFPKRPIGGWKR